MGKKTILYIDDEVINLLAFRAQFRREYTVLTTNSVDEALSLIGTEHVDCVFSDQRMPGSTGTELLATIRTCSPAVRRAIISGFLEDTQIQQGLLAGVVEDAFGKPYREQNIITFIESAREGGDQ